MREQPSVQKMILNLATRKFPGRNSLLVARNIAGVKMIDILADDFVPPMGVPSNIFSRLRKTETLKDADFALVPHEWVHIRKNVHYIKYLNTLSHKIPIVIFNTGDISPKVKVSNCLEVRTFIHPWEELTNKLIVPYPSKAREWIPRAWHETPKISFMGQIPRLSKTSLFSFSWRSIFHIFDSSVYLQRKISFVRAKRLSRVFNVELVRRNTFTAFKKNPNLEKLSSEFQLSLNNSDYVLCPRGFGNTSIRFYETLSAGRIPLLVRSGNVLPFLAQGSNWAEYILEVDLLGDWEKSISEHWNALSFSSDYLRKQKMNVELFLTQLDYRSFIEKSFHEYLIPTDSN